MPVIFLFGLDLCHLYVTILGYSPKTTVLKLLECLFLCNGYVTLVHIWGNLSTINYIDNTYIAFWYFKVSVVAYYHKTDKEEYFEWWAKIYYKFVYEISDEGER